jgi:hypothetical protein
LDQAGLDCLGASPFPFENPRFEVLDFLGFPWILSSETRLTNGLRGIFLEKFFPRLFASALSRRDGMSQPWRIEAQSCSSGKFSFFSDFLQDIAARRFRPRKL